MIPPPSPSRAARDNFSSNGKNPKDIFKREEIIGEGGFGVVYKGQNTLTQEIVAIKCVSLDSSLNTVAEVQREIEFFAKLHHPQIANYITSFVYESSELWIVLELVEGGSALEMVQWKNFGEEHVAVIMAEVLKAVDYMHSQQLVHRDLKADNILINLEGQVKLIDFSIVASLEEDVEGDAEVAGSLFWMAPEVIDHKPLTRKSDIWSLGITAIELFKSQPPHFNEDPGKIGNLIVSRPSPTILSEISPAFKDFLAKCLEKDPTKRPSAKDLLKHKFIKKAKKTALLKETVLKWRQATKKKALVFQARRKASLQLSPEDAAILAQWSFDDGTSQNSATSPTALPPLSETAAEDSSEIEKRVELTESIAELSKENDLLKEQLESQYANRRAQTDTTEITDAEQKMEEAVSRASLSEASVQVEEEVVAREGGEEKEEKVEEKVEEKKVEEEQKEEEKEEDKDEEEKVEEKEEEKVEIVEKIEEKLEEKEEKEEEKVEEEKVEEEKEEEKEEEEKEEIIEKEEAKIEEKLEEKEEKEEEKVEEKEEEIVEEKEEEKEEEKVEEEKVEEKEEIIEKEKETIEGKRIEEQNRGSNLEEDIEEE